MQVYDRVKLVEDYKLPSRQILKRNSVGTLRVYDEIAQLQIGVPGFPIQVIVPKLLLTKCVEEDLKDINYLLITPRIFHIGNYWSVKTGYTDDGKEMYLNGIIVDYKLALNEKDDIITIQFLDNTRKQYAKQYLNDFASYAPILD